MINKDNIIIGCLFKEPIFEDHNTKVLLTASSETMNNTDKVSKINVLVSL